MYSNIIGKMKMKNNKYPVQNLFSMLFLISFKIDYFTCYIRCNTIRFACARNRCIPDFSIKMRPINKINMGYWLGPFNLFGFLVYLLKNGGNRRELDVF